jgi:hypothetical protein
MRDYVYGIRRQPMNDEENIVSLIENEIVINPQASKRIYGDIDVEAETSKVAQFDD